MGLRFRRSIRLMPSVRLNVGMRGVSLSVGPRGASVNLSGRGVYGNVGISGTGISARSRLDSSARRGGSQSTRGHADSSGSTEITVSLSVNDNGALELRDANGDLLLPSVETKVKEVGAADIAALLEKECTARNALYHALTTIHRDSPASELPLAGFLMVTSIPYRRAAYSENQQSGYEIAVHEGGSSQNCA